MALPVNNNVKLNILLCEDDENLGMLLREYVQAKGFSCDLYGDGEAGYKAFLKGHSQHQPGHSDHFPHSKEPEGGRA